MDQGSDRLNELFGLSGRLALVTGASQGLGYEIARGFGRAGATVVVNGRDLGRLESAVKDLQAEGVDAHAAVFDVADAAATSDGLAAIRSAHGAIDILVANVGHRLRMPLPEVAPAAFAALLDVNVTASYALAHALAPAMAERNWGRIIFISSTAARIATSVTVAYSASKAALESLTRSFAVEYAASGITANALAPGGFATERNQKVAAAMSAPGHAPIKRWGRPDEIAGAAVFLASPSASYVNGHVLTVDGGMLASLG